MLPDDLRRLPSSRPDPARIDSLAFRGHATQLLRSLVHALSADVRVAAALGGFIVVIVGVPLAADLNIWIDEAFTLHSTGAGPLAAWHEAVVFEAQPPLYFVLESMWRMLDEGSVSFARIPSILFSAVAVAVIVGAAYRIAPGMPVLAVAVATALNPLVIWLSVEMRVYPLVFLVGAGLLWTFFEGFLVSKRSRQAQLCYTLLAGIGLYTQYYVGFFLAAQAMTLVVLRRSSLSAFAFAAVVIAVAFAPMARIVLMQVGASSEFVLPTSMSLALHEVGDAVFVVMLPHDVGWSGVAKIAGFALAGVLVVVLWSLGRPAIPIGPGFALVVQFALSLLVFTALFSVEGVPFVSIKYLTVVAPLSLLMAFLFLSTMQKNRALTLGIALMAYLCFTATDIWSQYRPPQMKSGDWQRLAAIISADKSATPVGVFPPELTLPLGWYLKKPMIAVPGPLPFRLDYVRRTTLRSEADVTRVLDPVRSRSERLWLVTTDKCDDSPSNYYNYHCRFMEAYLQQHYRLLRSVAFRGSLARLFVRLPVGPARQ